MPASFAVDLCRFRGKNGKPNTSDAHDRASVALGEALFEVMGVPASAVGDVPTGTPFAEMIAADLLARVRASPGTVVVEPERPLNVFQQYRHVGALAEIDAEPSRDHADAWRRLKAEIARSVIEPPSVVRRVSDMVGAVDQALEDEVSHRRSVLREVGSESLLRLDVAVSEPDAGRLPELKIGLSLKWSLRTDRAQDCRSQGAKLSALRRGRMPHFATVTMEPRPYMLNLLGGGSGDVDCVYHLDLPALTRAVENVYGHRTDKASRKTVDTFARLVEQRRLRDYDELVRYAVSM